MPENLENLEDFESIVDPNRDMDIEEPQPTPIGIYYSNDVITQLITDTSKILKNYTNSIKNSNDPEEEIAAFDHNSKPIKAKRKDCLYNMYTGNYFLKDDPKIVEDFFDASKCIIIEDKYEPEILINQSVSIIYKDISSKEGLKDASYTNKNYNEICFIFPQVYMSENDNSPCFVKQELLENSLFKYLFRENFANGIYYHKNIIDSYIAKGYSKKEDFDDVRAIKRMYRKRKDVYPFVNDKVSSTFINTLHKKYSFGFEIETISGFIPQYKDSQLEYTCVHDGSLRDEDGNVYGGEYITEVLQGDYGLLKLKKLMNEIAKRCLINRQCSVHLHLGGITFSKENVVLLYYTLLKLENQIFSMFPHSRRINEYCRTLPYIDIDINNIKSDYKYYIDYYYNDIIKILSGKSQCSKNINKRQNHPKGSKCGYDHSTPRYCWVNLIPSVFNTRMSNIYTIEFRIHSATKSYTKVKNWLLICMGLIDYVENHKTHLFNNDIDLFSIMKEVYGNKSEPLISYISKRIVKFTPETDPDLGDVDDVIEIEENVSFKNL